MVSRGCVLTALVAGLAAGYATYRHESRPATPPTPIVKDIVQILKGGDRYELMTVDPVTKDVIIRDRWFERIVADVPEGQLPWAEIKTRGRIGGDKNTIGYGNVLHVRTPKDLGPGRVEGKYPVQMQVVNAEQ